MAKSYKPWSDQDEVKLLAMRAAGASWSDIAGELRRTQMSVEVRAAEIKRRNTGRTEVAFTVE